MVYKSFPYRSLHERILRNPFLVEVILISTERGAQDISICIMCGNQVGTRQNRQSCLPPLAYWRQLSILLAKGALVSFEIVVSLSWLNRAGLPPTVLGLNILSKGVETGPAVTQFGPVYAQTIPRLPGARLRWA